MKPTIDVQNRHVPIKVLKEFEKNIGKEVSLQIHKDTADHFESPDLLLYLNDHLTEILVDKGSDAIIAVILLGIKALWGQIVSRKKMERVEIIFKTKSGNQIQYSITGKVSKATIEALTNKILTDLRRRKKDNITVKLIVNPKLKKWEKEKPFKLGKAEKKLLRQLRNGVTS